MNSTRILILTALILPTASVFLEIDALAAEETHRGQVAIGVEQAFKPVRIALPEFKLRADTVETIRAADLIRKTIVADLELTGLFDVIDPIEYHNLSLFDASRIIYDKWDLYNAQGVATGHIGLQGEGQILLEARLFDVKSRSRVFGKQYTGTEALNRKMAHIVSKLIIESFWGAGRGFPTSHIVFISDRTGGKGVKEIFAMDYDGENERQLTSSKFLNLTPACSPDGRYLGYTSYKRRNPDLYIMDLRTGETRLLHASGGQSTSPDWSRDSKRLVFTSSSAKSPGTDLYMINADGSGLRRLTHRRSVDCSASFSWKTDDILFTSNRTGSPQIYRMEVSGVDQSRVRLKGHYNDAASFSPDNRKIAYQSRTRGNAFDIYVYDVDQERSVRITEPRGSNENPAWSPDGRFLVYSGNRARGRYDLYLVRARSGEIPKRLTSTGNNQTPCFCP